MTDLLLKLFVKNHKNVTDPKVRGVYGTLAGVTGIVTNLIISLVKLFIGLFAGSVSVMADAVNNMADAGSSAITLVGFKLAGKPADREHPYGHAQIEYITGMIISFLIILIGGSFLVESFKSILKPEATKFDVITLVILGVTVLAKLWQWAFYRKLAKKIDSESLLASAQDSINDVISTTVVFVAAIFGHVTGLLIDGWVGCAVAVYIIVSGIKLVIETSGPLLGAAPDKDTVKAIADKVLSYEGVIGVHDLIVHSYGKSCTFASVHAEVPAEQDVLISHDVIDNIEADVRRDLGIELVIHLDPIVTNDPVVNEMRDYTASVISGIGHDVSFHDFRIVKGPTHTNVLFDVVVPVDYKLPDKELVNLISTEIRERYPDAYCVLHIDRDYSDFIGRDTK